MKLVRSDDDLDVPGTKLMDEIDPSSDTVRHILIPRPSKSPHDPLNWSLKWKLTVTAAQGIFILISLIGCLSLVPLVPYVVEEWNITPPQAALLTGAVVIALGYSNLIIVPCVEVFGRRITLLVCSTLCIAVNIWQALATSYESFIGARAFLGICSAINESLLPIIIIDMFFLHERGKYMSFYFFCYFMGLYIGPIISGGVALHVSWRWFFWACVIAQALCTVLILLVVPETKFVRTEDDTSVESLSEDDSPSLDKKIESSAVTHVENGQEQTIAESITGALDREHRIVGAPIRSQFKLWQPVDWKHVWSYLLLHVWTPIKIFFNPIVFWAGMTMGAAANTLLGVSLLQGSVLVSEPYNFNSADVGFANFAFAAGGIIGLLTAGSFSDWVAEALTRRNNGIREPEMRLWSIIPHMLMAVIGLVAVGLGFQYGWPWPALIVVGFGLIGLTTVSIPTIAVTYAVDCYKPISGQIMTICTVIKNTFGFGMSYYINDWAARDGALAPCMMLLGLVAGTCLFGLIFFPLFGKSLRRWTKNSSVHSL